MLKILDWLELHPGATWQDRWNSSGAGTDGTADWRDQAVAELEAAGKLGPRGGELHHVLGTGMVQLIGGDVLRPGPALAAGHHLPVPGSPRRWAGPVTPPGSPP